jgi:hypothetical protein
MHYYLRYFNKNTSLGILFRKEWTIEYTLTGNNKLKLGL